MSKYIAKLEKPNEYTYFFEILYEVSEDECIKKINSNTFPNCNKVKIIVGNAENDPIVKINKEKLDNNSLILFKFIEENGFKFREDSENYIENDETTTKYYTFLNKISIDKSNDKIFEIIDISDEIINFDIFKHGEQINPLLMNSPLTEFVYLKYYSNIYGPLKYEKNSITGGYNFKTFNENNDYTFKYKYESVKDIMYSLKSSEDDEENNFIFWGNEIKNKEKEGKEDFIETKTLISKFINKFTNQNNIPKSTSKALKDELSKENKEFTPERLEIIKNKLSSIEDFANFKNALIKEILNNEDWTNFICKKIVNENFSEIKTNSNIDNKIKEFEKEEKKLKESLRNLEEDIKDKTSELEKITKKQEEKVKAKIEEKVKELEADIDTKSKELEKITSEINEKITRLNLVNDIASLESEKKYSAEYNKRRKNEIDRELGEQEEKLKILKEQVAKYSQEDSKEYTKLLEEAISEIKKKYKDNAFEFFSVNEMLKLSSEKEKLEKEYLLNKKITDINFLPEDLKQEDFIINQIQFITKTAKRKIEKAEIINLLLCISQGFLTVFAGEPGTGKTSLCNILGKSFGLSNKENNRYLEVSVEKGWTSKRDFIGYYNPLTKKFDSANKKVFDAFSLLNLEAEKNIEEVPFFILLDEANLSPMEYYWADFMNICEIGTNQERTINLSEDYIYKIPKTLRFLATINYDHTTEILSPRLLDRAWIILLTSSNFEEDLNDLKEIFVENQNKTISYKTLELLINNDDKFLNAILSNKLKNIVVKLKENGTNVSPRVLKMIKNYCIKGEFLFNNLLTKEERKNDLIALDFAVAQKLLPMLEGYGDNYEKFLKEFSENELSGMERCQKIIFNMIDKGNKNMKYYHFFGR